MAPYKVLTQTGFYQPCYVFKEKSCLLVSVTLVFSHFLRKDFAHFCVSSEHLLDDGEGGECN